MIGFHYRYFKLLIWIPNPNNLIQTSQNSHLLSIGCKRKENSNFVMSSTEFHQQKYCKRQSLPASWLKSSSCGASLHHSSIIGLKLYCGSAHAIQSTMDFASFKSCKKKKACKITIRTETFAFRCSISKAKLQRVSKPPIWFSWCLHVEL